MIWCRRIRCSPLASLASRLTTQHISTSPKMHQSCQPYTTTTPLLWTYVKPTQAAQASGPKDSKFLSVGGTSTHGQGAVKGVEARGSHLQKPVPFGAVQMDMLPGEPVVRLCVGTLGREEVEVAEMA
jgi:hypothetical protein